MRSLRIPRGSGLLLITTALWISAGCKHRTDPRVTIKAFFQGAKVCDKPQMRGCFTPELLENMDKVFREGSRLVGITMDMFDGMCRVYRNARWRVETSRVTGDTAELTVKTGNQVVIFRLKWVHDRWWIYSLSSPAYRIDEQGLHEVGK